MMTADHLHRAQAVAREYDALLGLCAVWLGLGFVLGAFLHSAAFVAVGGGLGCASAGFYYRRYGLVKPKPARSVLAVVGVAVATVCVLAAYFLDRDLGGRVLITLLVAAAALAGGQLLMLRRTGLTWMHWTVYACVAVCSAGPIVGLGVGDELLPYVLVVGGLGLIAVGIVDHLRLVRFMSPVDERGDGER